MEIARLHRSSERTELVDFTQRLSKASWPTSLRALTWLASSSRLSADTATFNAAAGACRSKWPWALQVLQGRRVKLEPWRRVNG